MLENINIYIYVIDSFFIPFCECAVPVDPENGNLATIPGLTNGNQYQCTMIARAVTEGLIPRAIDSEPSNPTPVFIPSVAPQDTIFVTADASAQQEQQQPQQQQPQQQPAQEEEKAEAPAPKTAPGTYMNKKYNQ